MLVQLSRMSPASRPLDTNSHTRSYKSSAPNITPLAPRNLKLKIGQCPLRRDEYPIHVVSATNFTLATECQIATHLEEVPTTLNLETGDLNTNDISYNNELNAGINPFLR